MCPYFPTKPIFRTSSATSKDESEMGGVEYSSSPSYRRVGREPRRRRAWMKGFLIDAGTEHNQFYRKVVSMWDAWNLSNPIFTAWVTRANERSLIRNIDLPYLNRSGQSLKTFLLVLYDQFGIPPPSCVCITLEDATVPNTSLKLLHSIFAINNFFDKLVP